MVKKCVKILRIPVSYFLIFSIGTFCLFSPLFHFHPDTDHRNCNGYAYHSQFQKSTNSGQTSSTDYLNSKFHHSSHTPSLEDNDVFFQKEIVPRISFEDDKRIFSFYIFDNLIPSVPNNCPINYPLKFLIYIPLIEFNRITTDLSPPNC